MLGVDKKRAETPIKSRRERRGLVHRYFDVPGYVLRKGMLIFFSIGTLCSLFSGHGPDIRGVSYCENIVIMSH